LDSGDYQYQNLYDIKARGVELALRQGIGRGARFDASLALQEAELVGNGDMPNTPPWLAKLALVGPVWGETLQAALEVQAIGHRDYVWGENRYRLSTHSLVNLTLTATRLAPGLEAQLRVTNLLGREYFEPASDEAPVPRIPGYGRTVAFGLRYAF
jgi:outer membrane receptor protein involved in Fe transport